MTLVMRKSNQFPNDFSLVGSAAAPNVQSSFGTLKVTQQLQWTLMGQWGAVLHITGLLPLQRKRFQQSAAAVLWEDWEKSSFSGKGRCFLSTQPQLDRPVNQRLTSFRLFPPATIVIQSINSSLFRLLTSLNQWIKRLSEQKFVNKKAKTRPFCRRVEVLNW